VCIPHIVRLLLKRRYKGRTEPLHAVVGLRGKIAIVERDHGGALVAAIPGFLGVLMAIPIEREHILAALPGTILELHPDAAVLKALEPGAAYLVAEAVPKLQPIQRDGGSVRFMTTRVDRESPDDGAVFSQRVEPKRSPMD
jgi:hypothetical protein